MLFALFFACITLVSAEDGGKDFWDELSDDDVVIEDKADGKLYAKARFDVPVKRRLRLYPEVAKLLGRIQGQTNIEFIYEAKFPTLIFLDSEDVTVETIDISKMSHDEIMALLNLRGFGLTEETNSDKPDGNADTSKSNEAKENTSPPNDENQKQKTDL